MKSELGQQIDAGRYWLSALALGILILLVGCGQSTARVPEKEDGNVQSKLGDSTEETVTLDPFVEKAKARVAAATAPVTEWDGPVDGPAAQPGKLIVYIASDLRNGGVLGVSQGVEEAGAAIGWEIRVLDGRGTAQNRGVAFEEALSLNPDGIVIGGFDALEQQTYAEQADAQGIPLVGWHAAADPGPIPETPVFANISTDANDVAEIAAFYAVAESNGTAGVVIFTDSNFSVALAKSDAMAEVIEACAGCQLLSVEDVSLAETAIEMPETVTDLLGQHGDAWEYSLGINDLYFDFGGPALALAGKSESDPPHNLSAGDGSIVAYERIRNGEYQVGTVPEPLKMHGWQVIDELNRAMAGLPWSGYVTPVHLVTADNIAFDGGPENQFDPDNGYQDAYRAIWSGEAAE